MFFDFGNNFLGLSLAEFLVFIFVSQGVDLVFVTLGPLWVGILIGAQKRTRLWVIPVVPFAIGLALTIALYVSARDIYTDDITEIGLGTWILLALGTVAGIATFITWIVAWVLCISSKNYDVPKLDATETEA